MNGLDALAMRFNAFYVSLVMQQLNIRYIILLRSSKQLLQPFDFQVGGRHNQLAALFVRDAVFITVSVGRMKALNQFYACSWS